MRPGGGQGSCVGIITDCHYRASTRTKEGWGASEEAETGGREVSRHAERTALELEQASTEVGEGSTDAAPW